MGCEALPRAPPKDHWPFGIPLFRQFMAKGCVGIGYAGWIIQVQVTQHAFMALAVSYPYFRFPCRQSSKAAHT